MLFIVIGSFCDELKTRKPHIQCIYNDLLLHIVPKKQEINNLQTFLKK
jgi:hypothetical protein